MKNQKDLAFSEMRESINDYFKKNGLSKFGGGKILIKAIFYIMFTFCTYLLIINSGDNNWIRNITYAIMGIFCLPGIGFNIMHDASHRTFSENKFINNLMFHSLTIMGGSRQLWFLKHVVIHHVHTNSPDDDDRNSSPILRLHSTDKKRWFHKYQNFYAPIAYGLLFLFWVFVNDFVKYFKQQIKNTKIRPEQFKTKDHIEFWLSKIIHTYLFIFLPAQFIGVQNAIIGYLIMSYFCGITLSFVFQLAHVVEETEEIHNDNVEQSYNRDETQVRTTSNFSTKSKIAAFLFGGLNYQIEHHLFPYISHVHYPKISKIVRKYVKIAGLKYNEPTFLKALASHFKELKNLGIHEVS